MTYTYIDLFAGAGGFSLGFDDVGFKNVFSVEYDINAAKTYQRNFPNHLLLNQDIKTISNEDLIRLKGDQEVDVIIGGPPCQGFSLAGNIGRKFIEDERNYLFKEFVRFVELINPKMFVMENVARLATHNKGETLKEVVSAFETLGYRVKYKVLQACDYGVPQKRQRIFIVGYKSGDFEFPLPLNLVRTVKDAIDDLPSLDSGCSSLVPNHVAMNHSKQMLEKMSYVSDGGDRSEIPEDLRPTTGDVRKYIRYNSKEPSVTVTGDMRKVFHYSQNRALTPRELARLQTFPDEFIFEGSSISIQQQIGNAVPVELAKVIANSVMNTLMNTESAY